MTLWSFAEGGQCDRTHGRREQERRSQATV